jgi:hypothetical protein
MQDCDVVACFHERRNESSSDEEGAADYEDLHAPTAPTGAPLIVEFNPAKGVSVFTAHPS